MNEWALPTLNLKNCTSCGLCVEYCPTKAVAMIDGYPGITNPQACVYCGVCEEICPVGVIGLEYEFVLWSEDNPTQQEKK